MVQPADGLPIGAEALVEAVDDQSVAQIGGREQFAGLVGDNGCGEIRLLVGVDDALLARRQIELDEAHQVGVAGACDPQRGAVGGEPGDVAVVLVGVFGHLPEGPAGVVAHQDGEIPGRRLGARRAQDAIAIGVPADHVARILGDRNQPPGGQVQRIDVEHARVPLVHRDQDLPWGSARRGDDARADARERGQIPHTVRDPGVDSVDVVVLVTARVLHVQDVAAVARPKVAAYAPIPVIGDRALGPAGAGTHPHVEHALAGCEERDRLPVGRQTRGGPLGIVKEMLEREKGCGAHRRIMLVVCRAARRANGRGPARRRDT